MKKASLIIIVTLIILMVVSFSTNPGYNDYKEWFKYQVYEDMSDKSELEKSFYGFFADVISDAAVVRKDYKFYSLYTIDTDELQFKVLGLFNNFIVLDDTVN